MRRTTTSVTNIRITDITITITITSNTQPDNVSITRYRAFLPGRAFVEVSDYRPTRR